MEIRQVSSADPYPDAREALGRWMNRESDEPRKQSGPRCGICRGEIAEDDDCYPLIDEVVWH